MKKVLFATSALVMSAGFAAAEVAVSGDGRMGMIYDGDDIQFSSRARVLFTLTGESDAGLSFGGKFRVDQENYSSNPGGRSAAKGSAGEVWISGAYGKLSMGDVVGAAEAAIGDLYEIGYTDGEFANDIEEIWYLVGDGANKDQGPTVLYEYSIDSISFFASATDGSNTAWYSTTGSGVWGDVDETDGSDDVAYSLAAKYDAGNWWASLAYSKHDDADEIALGAEATFDQFSVKGVYAKYSDLYDGVYEFDSTIGLSAAYNMDAITVKGFWRRDSWDATVAGVSDEDYDSFGIGADYELGGGATLAGAIIDSDYLDGGRGDTVADLGVKFKF